MVFSAAFPFRPVAMPRFALLALLLAPLACTSSEPTLTPSPSLPPSADVPPVVSTPEPEPDPLYVDTEDGLRQAMADGLFGLYRAEVAVGDARRLNRGEVEAWLTGFALVSPQAVALARRALGPVLDEPFLAGFVLPGAAAAECASGQDVLYVAVPERYRGPDRPFSGYLVQDTCDLPPGDLGLFCTGGFGATADGTACSCTCTAGAAPGVGCVACGE